MSFYCFDLRCWWCITNNALANSLIHIKSEYTVVFTTWQSVRWFRWSGRIRRDWHFIICWWEQRFIDQLHSIDLNLFVTNFQQVELILSVLYAISWMWCSVADGSTFKNASNCRWKINRQSIVKSTLTSLYRVYYGPSV